jgi:hypothetical protein
LQDEELLAQQIAFDLVENELQSFLQQVQQRLEELAPPAPPAPAAEAAEADGDAMQTDAAAEASAPEAAAAVAYSAKAQQLRDILSGKAPIGLYLEFLYANNKADLQVRARARRRWRCLHGAAPLGRAGSSLPAGRRWPPPRRGPVGGLLPGKGSLGLAPGVERLQQGARLPGISRCSMLPLRPAGPVTWPPLPLPPPSLPPPPCRCSRTSRALLTRACRSRTRPPSWPTPTCMRVGTAAAATQRNAT